MATLSFLLQAVTKSNHADEVKNLLRIPNTKKALISVAFARTAGIHAISERLKELGPKVTVFVGIRNDITSVQALKLLLSLKVKLYAVDTGSRHIIFHPKIYIAIGDKTGNAIIGSANLTFNGLHNNIEVSTCVFLDMEMKADEDFSNAIYKSFNDMLANHPDHVINIKNDKEADALLSDGRVEDENIERAPVAATPKKVDGKAKLSAMKLNRVVPPPTASPAIPKISSVSAVKTAVKAVATIPTSVKYLVWESKPLSERDLNIPTGKTTNPTGSMGLKKGLYDDIDQRHYFYDTVFAGLAWGAKNPGSNIIRSKATFEIIIANISYGMFELSISHNTDTASASYKQGNMMTHLHWGDAKSLVADKSLLNRNLMLYRRNTIPPEYVLEID